MEQLCLLYKCAFLTLRADSLQARPLSVSDIIFYLVGGKKRADPISTHVHSYYRVVDVPDLHSPSTDLVDGS